MAQSNLSEEWRPVVGWESLYEVSNLGRVRSLSRIARNNRRFEGQMMALSRKSIGYAQVRISDGRGGVKSALVHRLVLEAFVGPCPAGLLACHNDGDGFNNRLDNLRWDTQQSNQLDRRKHGTVPFNKGEAHPQHKLTEAIVRRMFERRKEGWTNQRIADEAGVTCGMASMVLHGKRWQHITHAYQGNRVL
jgi:hypothetical protein